MILWWGELYPVLRQSNLQSRDWCIPVPSSPLERSFTEAGEGVLCLPFYGCQEAQFQVWLPLFLLGPRESNPKCVRTEFPKVSVSYEKVLFSAIHWSSWWNSLLSTALGDCIDKCFLHLIMQVSIILFLLPSFVVCFRI